MTTSQAARLAHLSSSTLLRAIQNKQLKAFSTPGGHYRVDRPSLDEFLRASGVASDKRRVMVIRLSALERDALIQELKNDPGFSLEEGSLSAADRQGPQCVILLDVSGSSKKAVSAKAVLSFLRRFCGPN